MVMTSAVDAVAVKKQKLEPPAEEHQPAEPLHHQVLTAEETGRLDEFVSKATKNYDFSHDFGHAVDVTNFAIKIAKEELSPEEWADASRVVVFAAMLHDVLDHKYTHLQVISQEERDEFIMSSFQERPEDGRLVISMIENVSFSKEKAGKRKDLGERGNRLLHILSDADRITAVGDVGVKRSIAYAAMVEGEGGSEASQVKHALEHCFDKLLKLRQDYIKTATGKALAKEGHEFLKQWVKATVADRLDEFYT